MEWLRGEGTGEGGEGGEGGTRKGNVSKGIVGKRKEGMDGWNDGKENGC